MVDFKNNFGDSCFMKSEQEWTVGKEDYSEYTHRANSFRWRVRHNGVVMATCRTKREAVAVMERMKANPPPVRHEVN